MVQDMQPSDTPAGTLRQQISPEEKPPSLNPRTAALNQGIEFAKASPLGKPRGPVNIFNTNTRRPEHHKSGQNASDITINPPFKDPRQSVRNDLFPLSRPLSRQDFYLPGQKQRQQILPAGKTFELSSSFFDGDQSNSAVRKDRPAAPRPMFSSLAPTSFPPKPLIKIDLTKQDSDDEFDPDAAMRDTKFGSTDPYMYIDPTKAGEDIKALLEGAFDDDDDKPKTRLRDLVGKPPPKKDATSSLADKLASLDVKDDLNDGTDGEENDDEEDDGTVEGMAVRLLPHQIAGVSWMLDKEIGERKKNGVLPKGGILADDMGLGKTIQSVTLILTNPRPAIDTEVEKGSKRKLPSKDVGKGTLVVAPLALIKQWEAEIKTRVSPSHALKTLVHHGPNRTRKAADLKKYDVVITTYQILASEHAGSSDHEEGIKVGCFGINWYRIILDEAHTIKNRSAKSTQACCALKSWYRWCLTGTPMQNNLDELQSLIHFLRIKPYNDISHWKQQITGPLKNGRGQFAIKRVQYFLKAFMKRRTKDILKQEGALNFGSSKKDGDEKSSGMKIVERNVETLICELDEYEREFYDKLAQRANDRLQDMMGGAKTDYIGALVLLLRLRQACNHPQLIRSAMEKDKDALVTAGLGSQSPTKKSSSVGDVDDLADMLGSLDVKNKTCDICQVKLSADCIEAGMIRCKDCESTLNIEAKSSSKTESKKTSKSKNRKIIIDSEDEDDNPNDDSEGSWLVSPSQRQFNLGKAGGVDDEDAEGVGRSLGSIDSETGSEDSDDEFTDRSKDYSKSEAEDVKSHEWNYQSKDYPSTKIRKLVEILKKEVPQHKVIVFSQFTTMLDLISPHLINASIKSVRYDGSLPNNVREAALQSLRTDPDVRVLLCSLKCGSLGLNLTVASRVIIVEPFWNPFVEEQAIDRVHRLNQTVDVHVYKLTIRDSVEERILELQEKKRELAKAAIEGGKTVAKLDMKDLLGLFGGVWDPAHDDQNLRNIGQPSQNNNLFQTRTPTTNSVRSSISSMTTSDRPTLTPDGSASGQKEEPSRGRRKIMETSARTNVRETDPVYRRR